MPLRWTMPEGYEKMMDAVSPEPSRVHLRYYFPDFFGVLAIEASKRLQASLPEYRQEYYKKAFDIMDLDLEIERQIKIELESVPPFDEETETNRNVATDNSRSGTNPIPTPTLNANNRKPMSKSISKTELLNRCLPLPPPLWARKSESDTPKTVRILPPRSSTTSESISAVYVPNEVGVGEEQVDSPNRSFKVLDNPNPDFQAEASTSVDHVHIAPLEEGVPFPPPPPAHTPSPTPLEEEDACANPTEDERATVAAQATTVVEGPHSSEIFDKMIIHTLINLPHPPNTFVGSDLGPITPGRPAPNSQHLKSEPRPRHRAAAPTNMAPAPKPPRPKPPPVRKARTFRLSYIGLKVDASDQDTGPPKFLGAMPQRRPRAPHAILPGPAAETADEPRSYILDGPLETADKAVAPPPVLLVVTSTDGGAFPELGSMRPLIGTAVAQRTVFARGGVYVTDGAGRAGFAAPSAPQGTRVAAAPAGPPPASIPRPRAACGFRAATAPRLSPRPLDAFALDDDHQWGVTGPRPITSTGFRPSRVSGLRAGAGPRPVGATNVCGEGQRCRPPQFMAEKTSTAERMLAEPREYAGATCLLMAVRDGSAWRHAGTGTIQSRSANAAATAWPGAEGDCGSSFVNRSVNHPVGSVSADFDIPHNGALPRDGRRAVPALRLGGCAMDYLGPRPIGGEPATPRRLQSAGSTCELARRASSEPGITSSNLADFLLLPPDACFRRSAEVQLDNEWRRPGSSRQAGSVSRRELALRNSVDKTAPTGSYSEATSLAATVGQAWSQPGHLSGKNSRLQQTCSVAASQPVLDTNFKLKYNNLQLLNGAEVSEDYKYFASSSRGDQTSRSHSQHLLMWQHEASKKHTHKDDGDLHSGQLQRMIVSSLQCLFFDFCNKYFFLLSDRYIGLLKLIRVIASKSSFSGTEQKQTPTLSEHEAMRLFSAVEEIPARGLRFEDFWVIMKAVAFRLAKQVQSQSDPNLTGDKLLWRLVKTHHRAQFALPKVKMQPKLDCQEKDANALMASPWDSFDHPEHNYSRIDTAPSETDIRSKI